MSGKALAAGSHRTLLLNLPAASPLPLTEPATRATQICQNDGVKFRTLLGCRPEVVFMVEQSDVTWLPGERDYQIGLRDDKLVCRNPQGRTLASLPKWLKELETAESLRALAEWLDDHRSKCLHRVERWMLRSLPIPRDVLQEVWPDPDWRASQENLVVAPVDAKGNADFEQTGLLRDVDTKRGFGVIDLDGETQWHKSPAVMVPHPILIADLAELRELASDLSISQTIDQLYRPVNIPTEEQRSLKSVNDYADGKFEQLNFALSLCRRLGYPADAE